MELVKLDISEDWYNSLVDDCKAIMTEAVFTSRWALIEGYWHLGERLITDSEYKKWEQNKSGRVLTRVSKATKIGERDLYRAMSFYNKYPDINSLPEGKNISWKKIITQYLPKPKDNKIEIPLPTGEYRVIVIDPPWKYDREYDPETSRVASPYLELEQSELLKMDMPAAKDSVLFLWTTHKFLWDAKELMDKWEFEYKANMVWDKEKIGMGVWLRMQCEFCLIGIKGKPTWENTTYRDIIRESRREHSRKPESFYKMVEDLFPANLKRPIHLDFFQREPRPGWDGWGDEVG